MLSTEQIQCYLAVNSDDHPFYLHLFESIDSTSTWIRENGQCGDVCIAEHQTAGRGRRGNQWLSPKAQNIAMSLLWCFAEMPANFSLLSLQVGLSTAKTLSKFGLLNHGVKWPNDIYWQTKKMGGILVESKTPAANNHNPPLQVIIGIGLNINMDASSLSLDRPWCSLNQALNQSSIDRNQLIAALLQQLRTDLDSFPQLDLADFQQQWQQYDILHRQTVTAEANGKRVHGTANGLDERGRIAIQLTSGELQYYSSAEIHIGALYGRNNLKILNVYDSIS